MDRAAIATEQHESVVDTALAWRVLGLITFSYALAYIDRQMLNLLVDPIKHSLTISDTQFSLIQGPAFVFAYLLATPVWGRLVDLSNRRNILVFCVSAWSVCTVLCGIAHTFPELMLARFGVGVSEASVLPITWSWLGDYFSAPRVPRAMSIFVCSSQLGGGFALVASGSVIALSDNLRSLIPAFASFETWQMAFVVIGAPGLLLAVVLLLAAREPPRRRMHTADASGRRPALREVAAFLWSRRAFYARMYVAIGMVLVVQLGTPAWFPSFLIRARGMPAAETGFRFGLLTVIFGSTGLLLGPTIAQWLIRKGRITTPLQVAAFATVGMFLCCLAIPYVPGHAGALAIGAAAIFFGCLPVAVLDAATQLATPNRMRGVVASLYTLSAQIISYGMGLTAIALVTDRVFGNPKMVGYSLQIVTCVASAIAGLLIFSVLRHHRRILGEMVEGDPKPREIPATEPMARVPQASS